jgi:hypothetical protein
MTTDTEAAPVLPLTLDYDHALNHAGGDPELLVRLCRIFLEELPLRLEALGHAFAARDLFRAGCALLQLRSCIVVFGSGQASATAEILDTAIRNRRARKVEREWLQLQAQLQHLVPQVQRLFLEMASPGSVQ